MTTPTLLDERAVLRLSAEETDGEGADENAREDVGEDVGAFLQGLITNDVTLPTPLYAGLLSAQGKTLFDFLVWREGADFLIDCESSACEELIKRLQLYRLRRKIVIARDTALQVHWSRSHPDNDAAQPDPRLAELGYRWLAPVAAKDAPSAQARWRAHRLACGIAEGRAEMEDILWLETNAAELNGVSFEKGCYIGQENTARMNWRQKVNRRLVVVELAQSDAKRRKVAHEDLNLAIDHLRLADLQGIGLPQWLARSLDAD